MKKKNSFLFAALLLSAGLLPALAPEAAAFCGFYVARADASLYNGASQVAVVRNGDRTVISMMNDFKGDLKEFALVVPVPVVLKEEQIHVADKALFDHLDAYSAPRLVEYFDPDPCLRIYPMASAPMADDARSARGKEEDRANALGVTIEARYTVGEYDILILSAKESSGLETWLTENGYKIPKGASRALKPYILQDMKFFVARVNLKEQARTGVSYLRPLQFAFESPKFMLPIRLGMVNANGPQELIVYLLTQEGRVETTNYRTVRLPSGMDIPVYVKEDFGSFYKAMFDRAVEKEGMRAVFTEYVWNMGWCDPCAADPLSADELRELGVFWLDGERPGRMAPGGSLRPLQVPSGPLPVMLTRLHLRYTAETFPEDLVFQETRDQENFQGRYVLRHAWKGDPSTCPEAERYFQDLRERREMEAETLAGLTGWDMKDIRMKMDLKSEGPEKPWWRRIWR